MFGTTAFRRQRHRARRRKRLRADGQIDPRHEVRLSFRALPRRVLVAALSFIAVPLAMLLGSAMPWLDAETIGPNRLGDYIFAYGRDSTAATSC